MRKVLLPILLIFTIDIAVAQKKPLDHSVYDSWQHIGERMISHDGKWVVYTIDPQQGDNELVIQSSDAKYKKTVPRGYGAVITEDSRYVLFKIKPLFKDTRDARIKKKKPDDMPKDSMAIVELGKEDVWKAAKTKSFRSPQKSYGWVAYQLEKNPEPPSKHKPSDGAANKKITDSFNRVIDSLQQVIQSMPVKKKRNRDENEGGDFIDHTAFTIDGADADGDDPTSAPADTGSDLVVRNLETGEEKVFSNVLEYYFSKKGNRLLIEQARNPKDSLSKLSIMVFDPVESRSIILSRGGNEFKNFVMTDDGLQIAYLGERDARPKELQKFYRVWYYQPGMDSAMLLVDKNSVGMQLGMTISEYGTLSFSKNGKRLFFGTCPVPIPKDTSLVEFEHAKVDIWHYNDDYLQTVQNFPPRLRMAQQENFLAVYDFESRNIKQLGSDRIPQVLITSEGDGDIFVGITDFGKRIESQWRGNTLKDIYAIDVKTGAKKLVKEHLFGQVYPSSTGKYIMWYDRLAKNYFAWDGISSRNITAKIKVPLWNEEFDSPDDPNNYGVMGWQEGDSAVYVYDKYDVWQLDPGARTLPVNYTASFGRISKESFRYVRTDPEELFFKHNQEVFYRTRNEVTKAGGLLKTVLRQQAVKNLYSSEYGGFLFGPVVKSKDGGFVIFTKENFTFSPDLYVWRGDENIKVGEKLIDSARRLSSLNPQQSGYLWGTAELFKWKAYNGKEATGIVYKPGDFDPKKKYPVIVYFYEKLTQDLYDYKEPAPIRSAVNVPFFVSRGYIIFMPDIEYKVGYPGKSAYDYIVSGARALVKKGWADSTNMALQGHSWGGYQAAQLATMTKLFKAVWAGAPVANMTSAYGGIRWESGISRQFQYEKAQSRIGGTLWQKLPLYLQNSPLFHLDKVTAPMVIMHNDADGAVPWYQGIELFTGLRRLGKKVWMFNYNGQGHGLTQRQDMLDYQVRMQQFFDWILKGGKPAKWITEGVPAVKKGKDWGLEVVD